MKKSTTLLLLLFSSLILNAQSWQQYFDSINKISFKEHRLMLDQLGIAALRPGPSGNPDAPNAANSDESRAKVYESLPNPLVFNDGSQVKDLKDWNIRREEILEEFDNEIYGIIPRNIPKVTWQIRSQKDTLIGNYKAIEKVLAGIVDNSGFPDLMVEISMTLTVPEGLPGPCPVIVEFGWDFPGMGRNRQNEGPGWKEQLLDKGWGYAILIPTSYQADNGAGLKQGIIGLTNHGQLRKNNEWGTLRAWAWGVSRAIDYFESDELVDAKRIGIEGLSRYGKAALVAMAYEPRIAIAFVGSSGAGGAKLLRRNFGEQVENLASSGEYHWFAPNFVKYAGPLNVNDLPVDAHELIALCAPRPVFISTGNPAVEGSWVDAKGMFLATVHAEPVYALHGKKGLGTITFPKPGESLTDGDLAFRMHEGGHTVVPNWPFFIEFAQRYFESDQ